MTSVSGGSLPLTNNDIESRHKWSVLAVLASAFLNLLGFTMAGPITPALGQHFNLEVGASFGSLTSAYPLGMLIGLFLWPQLSDKIGRKPIITASLLGSAIGLAAQSVVVSTHAPLHLFLATRVLAGSFAGSSPVSKAYLADVGASNGQLPRYLALRDAASTMAFIVGPLLGGVFFDARRRALLTAPQTTAAAGTSTSLAFVIAVSSAASLAAALFVGFFMNDMEENEKGTKEESANNNKSTPADDSSHVIACPLGIRLWTGVATVCLISFLFNVGDSTFHAFFSALLKDRLNLSAQKIGLAYTLFACISFTVSATFAGPSIKHLGPVVTCGLGLVAISTGLFGLAAVSPGLALIAAASLYYCGVPLYGPTIPTMLLRCVSPNRRGAVMGLDGAINTVARIVSPLFMGMLYQTKGPAAAFGVAGTAVAIAALVAATKRLQVLREQRKFQ